MIDELDTARNEIQAAAANSEGTVNEQLSSLDEGIMELGGGDKTTDAHVHVDRVAELEEKLDDLESETEGETRRHIENATAALRSLRERQDAEDDVS
ncbi:hypothetical protein C474_15844 [Halogeometricum pallidum JCM 14848]|uniref:Uncharacterized protein n=1 Tax=Halogeometricum pallidum JCM 14848 TaxID=1227487 RepID=M0CZE8_HALPD|nr:hypothetical protein [Halogeometricum pallidum]ELZ27988.1 hypothetical protein C474_15844 [Halogeometricum pallidum JCM 14848]